MTGIAIYLSGIGIFGVVLFRLKKSEQEQNGVIWVFLTAMLALCGQALAAGLYGLFHLPISNLSIGLAFWIAAAVLYVLFRKKHSQRYRFPGQDLLAVGLLIVAAALVGLYRYGIGMRINFSAGDAAAHMGMAKQIAVQHTLPGNMYFAALADGMLMEILSPILGMHRLYKAYVLGEIGWLLASAVIFWCIVRPYCKNTFLKWTALAVTILYTAGYPLYTIEFGFTYFGAAVTLIGMILFLTEEFMRQQIREAFGIAALCLCLYALIVCYTFFVPVVYLAVFFGIWKHFRKKTGKLLSSKMVVVELEVFLLPTVLGLWYSLKDLQYVNSGTSSGGSIATDGGCFNDVYSSFILLLPFLIYGVWQFRKKNQKQSFLLIFLLLQLLYMAFLFIRMMQGRVSIYYYVKNNNVLWLLAFFFAFFGFSILDTQARSMLVSVMLTGIFMVGMYLWGDGRIIARNERFITNPTYQYMGIYHFVYSFRDGFHLSNGTHQLYEYIIDMDTEQNRVVFGVGAEFEMRWYRAMTDQTNTFSYGTLEDLQETIPEDTEYLCVLYSELFQENQEYFEQLPDRVFETDTGFIVKMSED